jgi:hypothetical protein
VSKISDERKIKDAAMGELQTEKRGSRRIKKMSFMRKASQSKS